MNLIKKFENKQGVKFKHILIASTIFTVFIYAIFAAGAFAGWKSNDVVNYLKLNESYTECLNQNEELGVTLYDGNIYTHCTDINSFGCYDGCIYSEWIIYGYKNLTEQSELYNKCTTVCDKGEENYNWSGDMIER